jgi:soluble lytic murein transglycosylase-like protein
MANKGALKEGIKMVALLGLTAGVLIGGNGYIGKNVAEKNVKIKEIKQEDPGMLLEIETKKVMELSKEVGAIRAKIGDKQGGEESEGQGDKEGQKYHMEATNTNVFFLLGRLASSVGVRISSLDIEDAEVGMTVYGNYSDIMIYFKTLACFSDSFSLNTMQVMSYIQGNGTPADGYDLETNSNYDFVSGETTEPVEPLDIFYYEDRLKENDTILEMQKEIEANKYKDSTEKYAKMLEAKELKYSEIVNLVQSVSAKRKVPAHLIMMVIDTESGFDTAAKNSNTNGTKDRGLMQLNSKTAPQLMEVIHEEYVEGIEFLPALNVDLGAMYLKGIMDARGVSEKNISEADYHKILTSYNRGSAGADAWAHENKDFKVSEYETSYSKVTYAKREGYLEYDLPETDVNVSILEYSGAVESFRRQLVDYYESAEAIFAEGVEELVDYDEKVLVRTGFVLNKPTLLKKEVLFDLTYENNKVNPLSFGYAEEKPKVKVGTTGNNGEGDMGITEEQFMNKEWRRLEIQRAKRVLNNRLKLGLTIDLQLDYLEILSTYELMQE